MTGGALDVLQSRNSARLLLAHRALLWRAARNDLAVRYAGSLLGTSWVVLSPLLLLAIYGLVYLAIFRVRLPGLSPAEYVLYIFAGLVPYLATSEALALGVASVVAGKSVLNSTVFPIDLVPAKAVLTSLGTLATGLGVVVLGSAAAGRLRWTALALPLVVTLHALGVLGAVWALSLLNVVFRDLQSLLNLFLMVMLIASPIAYTPAMVPPRLTLLLLLNPFAYVVTAYQKILVLGELPTLRHTIVLVALGLGLFVSGAWAFSRGKRVVVDYV